MSKKSSKTNWKRMPPSISAGEWLKALGIAAVMGLLACAAVFSLPSGTDDARLSVVINRVMTSNPSTCFSVGGRYYDWIELVNLEDTAVSLEGWRLSDDPDLRGGFVFGDVTLPGRGSLIVYCDEDPNGEDGGEVFCGFKLDSNGELLLLADKGQRRVQALDVPAMAASDVYQRDASGEYSVRTFEQMLASGAVNLRPDYDPSGVTISELMAANRTVLQDEDGDYSDWLELYNGGSAPVSLAGCALSDDDANQRKWMLPDIALQPGEYRLVFASGKDRRDAEGELHANFKLSASGEAVRLYDPAGEVLTYVEYDGIEADASLSRQPDGTMTAELKPTPGFENTELGARRALSVAGRNSLGLYINEIMVSGSGFDWIELYNAGDKSADLSGMGLSDSTTHPRRWQFPEGTILPAGGYMAVALAGSEGPSGLQDGYFSADFALSAGETACLSLPDGTLLDKVTLFDQFRDMSYGRAEGQANFRWFLETTPGAKNADESYERKAAQVQFSEPGGCREDDSVTVELTSDADVTIYYTTDGTEPTNKSNVYSGPLRLTTSTVLKAVAWRQDLVPSDMEARTYVLGVNHTLRLVSVSGKKSRLNGSTGMLKTGIKGTGSDAFVEIYEPDGTRLIAQDCLMKLAGHNSRVGQAQKGFSLRANKKYGIAWFNAPLFSNRDYTRYKSIVMRASGQDSMKTLMRDSILTSLAADTSVMYQETECSVLYVNGQYWGVYNMRERVSKHSIAQFEGWDNPDDVELREGKGTSSADFQKMLSWVRNHDLSSDANVETLRQWMDIENYLEYVMLEMYTNNQDMNNVRFYRNPGADNKWRWVLFDLDLSYIIDGNSADDWLHGDTVGSITPQSNLLFKHLMKNAKLKDWFLTRFGELLATTFSVENVTGKIQERYELLLPEMAAECKRWKWNLATWKRYGKAMVRYAQQRPSKLVGYLTDSFHLSDAQAQTYFGDAIAKNG